MLKGEVGKKFPTANPSRSFESGTASEGDLRVLIVDPILGSRFALVQAASQPGFVVDASASIEDAKQHLDRMPYALVIAEEHLVGGSGVDFLESMASLHPDTLRALVTAEEGLAWRRSAIDRAGLALLLTKPVGPEELRRTLRELFGTASPYASWSTLSPIDSVERAPAIAASEGSNADRHLEVVLRGLLAGLNSCESELEVFELLHGELIDPFHVSRWLWVDEEHGTASALAGDWPIRSGLALGELAPRDHTLLRAARRSFRVTRLEQRQDRDRVNPATACCVGLPIQSGGRRSMTGLVWAGEGSAQALVSILREVQGGLQMAFRRIRDAESRADAARVLARRVSQELRMPVGALTHAIDRLRSEAEQAGLASVWVERISSESERVVRAVEHLEGEILAESGSQNATTN